MGLNTFNEFVMRRVGSKPWKAKKADVLRFWKGLSPNLPIKMEAVDNKHTGTRFRSDGIRITGSPEFINSVISRLKDMAFLENDNQRVDVEYRQVDPKPNELEKKYVFYMHLVKRS